MIPYQFKALTLARSGIVKSHKAASAFCTVMSLGNILPYDIAGQYLVLIALIAADFTS